MVESHELIGKNSICWNDFLSYEMNARKGSNDFLWPNSGTLGTYRPRQEKHKVAWSKSFPGGGCQQGL